MLQLAQVMAKQSVEELASPSAIPTGAMSEYPSAASRVQKTARESDTETVLASAPM